MNVITRLLFGSQILDTAESKYNGHLVVKRDYAWGTYIQAGGLTQSGGVMETIWKSVCKKLQNSKIPKFQTVLILGLGGGTVAKLIHKNWPNSKITGVDVDPIMVGLGTRYLELGTSRTKIVISDAYEYCDKRKAKSGKYDLICIDLYNGDEYPEKFKSTKFVQLVYKLLSEDGTALFNRLYFDEKRSDAVKFGKELEKVFSKVEWFYPQANLMFICRK